MPTTGCGDGQLAESIDRPGSPAYGSGFDLPATERSKQKQHREQRKCEMQTDRMGEEADDCRPDEIASIAQCGDR